MGLGERRIRELGRQLLEEPSWVRRAKAAEQFGHMFCSERLSQAERALAEEFFRLTLFDDEVLVRRVLAEGLKRAQSLSRDILLALAADEAEVASPLIEHSPLFEEEDLFRILDASSAAHRLAVARRSSITEEVSAPLIASGDEVLIATLLRNRGARIGEEQLWSLIAAAPRPRVVDALLRRHATLPPRLLAALSEVYAAFSIAGRACKWRIPGEAAWHGFGGSVAERQVHRRGRAHMHSGVA